MGGFEHVADPELYIRWCQFGLLSPIAHLFGMEHPNYKEPWNYGEQAQRIFKRYDELRYSLIPYLYSASYQMHTTGRPLMRALVLDYQQDENVYGITDQYMLGESMMVCPVTTKGAQTRVVYLPKGTWTDYWTGKRYQGKQYLSVLCPIEQLPIFIKEGAIIPTQEVLEYIGEKEIHSLTVDIYPSEKSSFTLYDDDGKSLDYQQGSYATTPIEVTKGSTETRVLIEPSQGNYKIPDRSYELNIRMAHTPKSVKVNDISYKIGGSAGRAKTAFFEKGILTFSVPPNSKGIDVLVTK